MLKFKFRFQIFAFSTLVFFLGACGQSAQAPQNPIDVVFDEDEVPSEMEVSDSRIDPIRGTWLIKPNGELSFESGSLVFSAHSRLLTLIEYLRVESSQSSVLCLISKRGEVIDTSNLLKGEELAQKKKEFSQFTPRLRVRFASVASLTQDPECTEYAKNIDDEIKAEIDHEKNIIASTNENNEVIALRLEGKEYFYQP